MPNVTENEAKQALEEIKKAIEEQRKVYEAKLEAVSKQKSGADFDEKIERINEVLAKQEKTQREFRRQQEEAEAKRVAEVAEWKAMKDDQDRKLEARVNRWALGLGGAADEANPNEKLSRKAFQGYIRGGRESLSADEFKVLTFGTDTTGGYLGTPASFVQELIKAETLFSPMRNLITVRPMSSAELQQPKRTGTASATRLSEGATRSETANPTYGLVKIAAPEMYAEARVTLMQIEDSAFDMEALLRDEFAEQFGVLEGQEIISGNGVGKCLGILDANAAGAGAPIAYTKSGSAASIAGAAGVQGDGVVNLFHAVKTAYAVRGTWILNRASLGKVRLLKDTTGQYLWQPGLVPGNPNTILSAPYVECPDMPDEGANTFPIAFGDWKRAFVLAERVDMQIFRDPFSIAGQVKFSARRRVGGQVVLGEAVRLLKCEA